jgi:hypothetical protein
MPSWFIHSTKKRQAKTNGKRSCRKNKRNIAVENEPKFAEKKKAISDTI